MPDEQQSPLDSAVSVEAMERYQRGLDSLLPAERNAVIARIELDLPYADIAALLEKPSEDAARMAVGRALRKLAEAMGRG